MCERNSCVCEQRVYIKKLLYEPQVYVGEKRKKYLNVNRVWPCDVKRESSNAYTEKVCHV